MSEAHVSILLFIDLRTWRGQAARSDKIGDEEKSAHADYDFWLKSAPEA